MIGPMCQANCPETRRDKLEGQKVQKKCRCGTVLQLLPSHVTGDSECVSGREYVRLSRERSVMEMHLRNKLLSAEL